MKTRSLLRLALVASTASSALIAAPAMAQNLPDTGNVTAVTRGLGGTPGPTTPTFSNPTPQQLQIGLRDNRTILTWRGTGFDVATGNTVNFVDARATTGVTNRTTNIAVLNRDLSNGASFINGSITSSNNISVILVNTNGINFGGPTGGTISTGSFIASTNDINSDDDFLNAATSLRFGRPGTAAASIVSGGMAITANGTGVSSDGGRLGDVVLIGQQLTINNSVNTAQITAANGDVGMIVARDVTVQFAPGSPLSYTITEGSNSMAQTPLLLTQGISARNVTMGMFFAGGPNNLSTMLVGGSLTATGATVTDRGVVLVAGSAAPGVTLASAPGTQIGSLINTFGLINVQNAVTSAADIYFSTGIGAGTNGLSNSTAGNPTIGTLSASRLLRIDGSTFNSANSANTIRGGTVRFNTGATLNGSVQATAGDLILNAPAAPFFLNANASASGNITGTFSGLTVGLAAGISANGSVTLAGNLTLNAGTLIATGAIDITGSLSGAYIESTRSTVTQRGGTVFLSTARAAGTIDMTSTGGLRISTVASTGGNVLLRAPTASGQGQLQFDSMTGQDITLIGSGLSGGFSTTDNAGQISGRNVTINLGTLADSARLSTVTASGDLSITANSITAFTLTSTGGSVTLNGGRVVDVRLGLNANSFVSINATGTLGTPNVSLNNVVATTGDLSITVNNGGSLILNGATVGRDLMVALNVPTQSAIGGRATLQRGFSVGRNAMITASGLSSRVEFGPSFFGDPAYMANGGFSVQASAISSLSGAQPTVIMANAAGTTTNAPTLDLYATGNLASIILASNTQLMGGPARQSDIRVRLDNAGSQLTFGSVSARGLLGAIGANTLFTNGLSTTNAISFAGASTLTNDLLLTGSTISLANFTVTNGAMTLRAVSTDVAFAGLTITSALTATGDIVARAAAGNLVLSTNARLTAPNVVLSAPGAFVNATSGTASPITGRWVIYAGAPTGNQFGTNLNSNNTALWGSTIDTRAPSTITGNRYVFALRPTLTVLPDSFSKVYGTDLTGPGAMIPFTVTGFQPGVANAFLADTAATAFSGTPGFTSAGLAPRASVAGGPYALSAGLGTLVSASGYAFAFGAPGQITVTPLALTSSVQVNAKTYDGNRTGTGTVTLNGVVAGDTVGTAGTTFTFADRNAGLGKTVAIAGTTLTGADAGNYTFTVPATALGDILRAVLTANVTANNKTYDGNRTGSGNVTLNGVVAGDDVGTAGTTFTFADRNAGTGKTVTIAGTTLTGADAGNYTLTVPATAFADILRAVLTANVVANNKTYDGNRTGSGNVTLNGVVAGD
ncbi:YDG domain-containing protein, partial [Sphingomonas sp.]|uniref:beta strand repeat-containing protein n=1 Tax=Sphingomonas sp. TaxID=28214 RepID=UPI001D490FB3